MPYGDGVAWLLRDGDVLASLEVAATRSARRRGLLGRDHLEGALLLERTRSVHTLGMRFPIDVAFLDGSEYVAQANREPQDNGLTAYLQDYPSFCFSDLPGRLLEFGRAPFSSCRNPYRARNRADNSTI